MLMTAIVQYVLLVGQRPETSGPEISILVELDILNPSIQDKPKFELMDFSRYGAFCAG